jgi:hypothetical protein
MTFSLFDENIRHGDPRNENVENRTAVRLSHVFQ